MTKEEVFPSPTISVQIHFMNICMSPTVINGGTNRSTNRTQDKVSIYHLKEQH